MAPTSLGLSFPERNTLCFEKGGIALETKLCIANVYGVSIMKIILNKCYGGFSLSERALSVISERKGYVCGDFNRHRTDWDLVAVVEQLGEAANGRNAKLTVVNVSPGRQFFIDEYDGIESLKFKDEINWIKS